MKHPALIIFVLSTSIALLALYVGFTSPAAKLTDHDLVDDGSDTSDPGRPAPSKRVAQPRTQDSSAMNDIGFVSEEIVISNACFQPSLSTECTNELSALIPNKALPDYIGLTYGDLFDAITYLRAAKILEEGIEFPYEVTIIESRFGLYVGVDKYGEVEEGARVIAQAMTRND